MYPPRQNYQVHNNPELIDKALHSKSNEVPIEYTGYQGDGNSPALPMKKQRP